jgi:outer membrane lipoprotein-sorting protein
MLTLEYTNVKLNAAILVDEFAFQAPSTAFDVALFCLVPR